MIDHSSCDHPRTSKDRAACRKAKGAGKVHASTTAKNKVSIGGRAGRTLTWEQANAVGEVDDKTLDDRIRSSKSRPPASPVRITKVDPSTLR